MLNQSADGTKETKTIRGELRLQNRMRVEFEMAGSKIGHDASKVAIVLAQTMLDDATLLPPPLAIG